MRRTLLVWLLLLPAATAFSDEGMWTFDNFPKKTVKDKYRVEVTDGWLDNLRLSTVRLEEGCTGSFVSPNGLLLTNHHCAEACLSDNSTAARDLLADGFLARTRDEEVRCQTQQISVLMATEEVTAKVVAATSGLDARASNEARKKEMTHLEQACEAAADPKTGPLACQSVALYEGGQYFLYKYKRYSDVRLVFAPDNAMASFGGDPDNFQFPRWDLDLAVLRVYEKGQPAPTPHHLRLDFAGPAEGELVFVSGHPGSTDRLMTVDELETQRGLTLPDWLLRAEELRGRLIQFGKTGSEPNRIVQKPLLRLENSIKVRRKELDALLDDALMARKRAQEDALRAAIAASPELTALVGDAWEQMARAQARARDLALRYQYLERGVGFQSELFRYARSLVRASTERVKPNEERLREYTEAALPRLEQGLLAKTPVYAELEELTLSFSLERMREWLGPDDPLVRKLLATQSPDSLAIELVEASGLSDPALREELWKGGEAAVAASTDPMIVLAREIDGEARAIRRRYEDEVEAPVRAASERIARARFKILGTGVYPDATFTLRLNFGTVRGWVEKGQPVKPFTVLATAFERATGQDPFRIPQTWLDARPRLDASTKFNLSTDNDIVGGNSGSPLVNARGRLVGLMFDGNIHSISGSYWFDSEKNRAIAVNPTIMREALTKVYGADALLAELAADK